MTELRFDPVGLAEGLVLMELVRAFCREDGREFGPAAKAAVLAIAHGEPLARAWLARKGGETVGYVVVTIGYSIEYGGRDGFIDDLYLVPAARGQGLGRRLVEFACREAAALGIRTLHLEVEADNERAERLYQQAGFEQTGRKLMRRRLS